MLHPLPETRQRKYLQFACWLQRRLLRALCVLPVGAAVDQDWLHGIWTDIDSDWITSFWGNSNGPRNFAINTIAGASHSIKRRLWRSFIQQTRIRRLYTPGRKTRIEVIQWAAPKKNPTNDELVLQAFVELMRAFYKRELKDGFTLRAGRISYETIMKTGLADSSICPLCDGKLDPRNRVIDHFYPQEIFPALTIFPDNLIPICDTCNGPRAKLAKPPFTLNEKREVDVSEWFHPRWRSAKHYLLVRVARNNNNRLEMAIVATSQAFEVHVRNFKQLTNIQSTWADRLQAAVRQEQKDIESELRRARSRGTIVDEKVVKDTLIDRRKYYLDNIGEEVFAYRMHGIYDFMASDSACVKEILAQVNE